jgi:hypothetical protein
MFKKYVSEFDQFMEHYLEEHPEVTDEQQHNWQSFWEPQIDPLASRFARESYVADSMYGFSWSAWRTQPATTQSPEQAAR